MDSWLTFIFFGVMIAVAMVLVALYINKKNSDSSSPSIQPPSDPQPPTEGD